MMIRSIRFLITIILTVFQTVFINAQKVDLAKKLTDNTITAVNRTIAVDKNNNEAISLDAREGDGLGILENISFKKGTITLKIKGENKPGSSFVGFAFNIQNDSVYEAIYFRPFNFVAKQQIRKDHMLQYIYHPEFTWRKLRTERTGEFENEIINPPSPDAYFKVQLEIDDDEVSVFVNDAKEPSLKVKRLTKAKSDKVGLWAGYNSIGNFKELEFITIKK